MRRLALIAAATVAAMVAWEALVVFGTINGWGRSTLAPRGDLPAFWNASVGLINDNSHGNAAFALIHEGKVYGEPFHWKGKPVDHDAQFQLASPAALRRCAACWPIPTRASVASR